MVQKTVKSHSGDIGLETQTFCPTCTATQYMWRQFPSVCNELSKVHESKIQGQHISKSVTCIHFLLPRSADSDLQYCLETHFRPVTLERYYRPHVYYRRTSRVRPPKFPGPRSADSDLCTPGHISSNPGTIILFNMSLYIILFCQNNFGKNAPTLSPTQRKTVTVML